ncbi:hypothetical protein T12_350 [Trichinella patagoniensis]|uniref:Uncharacterized protein n=1 Tax=Trichinella patagoniensis TaxID=990121 RepID=A0A0V0Y7E5_9BILA|nr:hypothetical protein T12_350 [Trichinella patagoniensis]
MQPQIQQRKTLKRLCKGSDWYEEQTRSKLRKTVKSH